MAVSRTRSLLLQIDSVRRFVPFHSWTVLAVLVLLMCAFAWMPWYIGAFAVGCAMGLVRVRRSAEANTRYYEWLSLTPWTAAKPLPFSAPVFTWQDIVLFVLFMVPALRAETADHTLSAYPTGFLSAFLLGRTMLLGNVKAGLFGSIMVFCWLVLFTCLPMGQVVVLGILIAMLVLDQAMTPRGIRQLYQAILKRLRTGALPPAMAYTAPELFELCGRKTYPSCSHASALLFALVSGWVTFLLAQYIALTNDSRTFTTIGIVVITTGLVTGRLARYLRDGGHPPIAMWARITTRRFIIPDYDRVLVAPLLVLVLGAIAVLHSVRYTIPPHVLAMSVALLVYATCALGPSLKSFRLTGRFHWRVPPPETDDDEDEGPVKVTPAPQPTSTLHRPIGGLCLDIARWFAPRASYYTHWTMVWIGAIVVVDLVLLLNVLASSLVDEGAWFTGVIIVSGLAGIAILSAMLVVWPASRLWKFHPIASPSYMEWLRQLSWRPGEPLPMGLVRWGALDLLPLGLLLLGPACIALRIVYEDRNNPNVTDAAWVLFATMVMLSVVFLLAATRLLYRMGQRSALVALALLVGLAAHLGPHPLQICAVLVVMIAVAAWGLGRAWRDYPWKNTWSASSCIYGPGRFRREPVARAGRTMQYLSGKCLPLVPRRSTRAMCIVVITWWLYVIASYSWYEHDTVFWLLLLAAALYRFAAYRGASVTPLLGILGRLRTGRLIIPRYDCVYVGPLMALVAGVGLIFLFRETGAPRNVAMPCTAAAVLSILCFAPPSLRRWRLLGLY